MRRCRNTIVVFNWRILTTCCMLLGNLPFLLQWDTHRRGSRGPQGAHHFLELILALPPWFHANFMLAF